MRECVFYMAGRERDLEKRRITKRWLTKNANEEGGGGGKKEWLKFLKIIQRALSKRNSRGELLTRENEFEVMLWRNYIL